MLLIAVVSALTRLNGARGHRHGVSNRTCGSDVAQLQRAAADRGAAGIDVIPGQRQRASACLDQFSSDARNGAAHLGGEIVGSDRDIVDAEIEIACARDRACGEPARLRRAGRTAAEIDQTARIVGDRGIAPQALSRKSRCRYW